MISPSPGFTGARIERADHIRNNAGLLAGAMASLSARLMLLNGIDLEADEQGQIRWGSLAEAPADAELCFLGLVDGKPHFVAVPPPDVPVDARSRTVWRVLTLLDPDQMALYAAARTLVDWHARHRHCAMCGAPTQMRKGGWQRICEGCGAEHFPRTDPVVIMLAEHEDCVLVGRQHGWPGRNYSALAGFVEPGESIEEAVTRELFEEAGLHVDDVRYVASQPWPFPSQLMIGCIAQARGRALTLDETEVEAAMWVSRAEVQAALAGEPGAAFAAPPPFAIAHSLLSHWAARGT